jgi:two-component system sensor histidine kinase PilS (NtrC family)
MAGGALRLRPFHNGGLTMFRILPEVRTLIAVRTVAVTTLVVVVLIVQFTTDQLLPISYLYLVAGLTFALTIVYLVVAALLPDRTLNLSVQIAGDLLVETLLVYFTGGLDSPFSFLYLVSIITASMLLYRRGGLLTASGCVILYAGLGDLLYYGIIPVPEQGFFSMTPFSSFRLYLNMATNFAGFYATALLTSYVSEKLRVTSLELDANRRSLAQLKVLNENVIASIPSGLLTVAPSGVISFANPSACEILACPAVELVGRPLADLELFPEENWEQLRDAMLTRRVVRGETEHYKREGEPVTIGYAVTPLNTLDGQPAGISIIFQDLTDVKRLEEQLRLKDRMAAVGELSAGIAHEIRNPLAAIAGSVQVLKKSERLAPQEQRLMSIILKESDRLNKSIQDFLQFVRPSERRAIEFDVVASLSETLDLLSNSLELGAEHTIERALDPPRYMLVGDPDQIRQVFWNIARNAIQAMPRGGALRVASATTHDGIRIVFADSGRGMNDHEQRALFQPFRTNFPTGTGLGMAISYRIVQEHGGRIEIDSAPGSGTAIALTLPRVPTMR